VWQYSETAKVKEVLTTYSHKTCSSLKEATIDVVWLPNSDRLD